MSDTSGTTGLDGAPIEAMKRGLDSELLQALDGICYVTDPDGVIRSVGAANWNAFAEANGVPGLTARVVTGKNLLEFVAGDRLRGQISRVMSRLGSGEYAAWVMPYQCDGPDRRRSMRLSITPIRPRKVCKGFLFQSVTLEAEQRPPIDLFDFKALENKSAEDLKLPLVDMCSYCQRVRSEGVFDNQWITPEKYYAEGGTSKVRISHVICDPCFEAAEKDFYR